MPTWTRAAAAKRSPGVGSAHPSLSTVIVAANAPKNVLRFIACFRSAHLKQGAAVRRQGDAYVFGLFGGRIVPGILGGMFLVIETEVLPGGAHRGRAGAEIEEGKEFCVTPCAWLVDRGAPDTDVFKASAQRRGIDGTAIGGVLIHEKNSLVGDERTRVVVEPSQVAAEDEGRASHGPKCEFGALLVLRLARLPRFAPSGVWAKPAFRKHVGVRPISRPGVHEPFCQEIEGALHPGGEVIIRLVGESPSIPVVVGDAPHLRILADLRGVLKRGGARRKAQDDRPAGFANGFSDLANLGGAVGTIGYAIGLEKIHSP